MSNPFGQYHQFLNNVSDVQNRNRILRAELFAFKSKNKVVLQQIEETRQKIRDAEKHRKILTKQTGDGNEKQNELIKIFGQLKNAIVHEQSNNKIHQMSVQKELKKLAEKRDYYDKMLTEVRTKVGLCKNVWESRGSVKELRKVQKDFENYQDSLKKEKLASELEVEIGSIGDEIISLEERVSNLKKEKSNEIEEMKGSKKILKELQNKLQDKKKTLETTESEKKIIEEELAEVCEALQAMVFVFEKQMCLGCLRNMDPEELEKSVNKYGDDLEDDLSMERVDQDQV